MLSYTPAGGGVIHTCTVPGAVGGFGRDTDRPAFTLVGGVLLPLARGKEKVGELLVAGEARTPGLALVLCKYTDDTM